MSKLIKNIFIFCSITIIVSSCATLNKEECKTANWKTIGYEDGTKGYKASRIGKHRKACAEYGIQPDLITYSAGRKRGLSHYCIPNTAYKKGLYGNSYNGVCAGNNESAFLNAYNDGLKIHKEKVILSRMKNDYAKEKKYIDSLEIELNKKEHLVVSGKLTKIKALILLNETKDIAVEVGKAKSNLYLLDDDIQKQSQHIQYLMSQHRY